MSKKNLFVPLDTPMFQPNHRRPRTRREFLAQGFSAGGAAAFLGGGLAGLASSAAQSLNLYTDDELGSCGLDGSSSRKVPFISFDLAGGANMAGSNVLVGGQGGQMDFLSTAGYNKQGLPGDMIPGGTETALFEPNPDSNGDNTDTTLGLAFHADSAFLRGIKASTSAEARANINGAVIPARSENDTGNNPHNPMYAIARIGKDRNDADPGALTGQLLSLIGSRNSMSGGNSMAPAQYIDADLTPTKIDRPQDVVGLVSVGDFGNLLSEQQVVDVMERVARISEGKINNVNTLLSDDSVVREKLRCTYLENAYNSDIYRNPGVLNPLSDDDIVGTGGIFAGLDANGNPVISDREFQKTASVMKLVIDGNPYPYAAAGTIAMGGYDYHGGGRSTGEVRDFRAGRCMGACLEYAHRKGRPLMLYVSSDGSLSSNGQIEDTPLGRGKGMWTSDNQQTAASFFLVYDPAGRPPLRDDGPEGEEGHRQIGHMRASGDVETSSSPAANNVDQLVQMVVLNYLALHGEEGSFVTRYVNEQLTQGLGTTALERYIAFQALPSISGGEIPAIL